MTVLTEHQKEILRYLGKTELKDSFFFTGGTALAAFYLEHRYSEDLDFFTSNSDSIRSVSSILDRISSDLKIEIKIRRMIHSFIEVFLKFQDGEGIKMDFALDSPFRFEAPKRFENYGIEVDSLRDLGANKISALFDRAESKDFVDAFFLQKEFQPMDKLIADAKEKHIGIEDYWLAQAFEQVQSLTFLPRMIKPVALEQLKQFFLAEASKLIDSL